MGSRMKREPQTPLLIAAPDARARALSLVGWSNYLVFESGRSRESIDTRGRTCFRGSLPPMFVLALLSVAALFSFAGWHSWVTQSTTRTLSHSLWDWLALVFPAVIALASGSLGVHCLLWRRCLIVDTRTPGGPMLVLRERLGIRVTETRAPLHTCIAIRTRVTVQTRNGRGRIVPTLQVLLPDARPFLIWHGKDSAVDAAAARWTELTGQAVSVG